jgi:hypothetical protein
MGWGMMIRDKYVALETRVETVIGGTDWEHQALWGFDMLEWRAKSWQVCMCGESSVFCMREVIGFCITWPIYIGNLQPALVYAWIQCLWHINVSHLLVTPLVTDSWQVEWDYACSVLDKMLGREAEWRAWEVSNNEIQWGKTDVSGGWEATPPASPVCVDSGWPGLAAQVNECCGTWGLSPLTSLRSLM